MADPQRTAQALVLPGPGEPLVLQTVHLSALLADEALVEIHATGICHTDLSCMNGTLPTATPAVLGHEGAGIVVEVGSGVTHVAKGDKVLLSVNYCQTCPSCVAGHPNFCDEALPRNFGGRRVADGSATVSILDDGGARVDCYSVFFGQSSFASHAVVNRACMVKVPVETPLELFAPLGCGVLTGVGSILNTLDVKEGSSVAVFGVGNVGLSAVMAARIRNARVIVAIDLDERRLELAKTLGATHTVDGSSEDVVAQVKKWSPQGAGVAYAADCTGSPRVIANMLECLAVRGRAAQVGVAAPDQTVPVKILQHLLRGQEYVGCAGGDALPSALLPWIMEQQQRGRFPLEKLISYYDVQDFARAFEDAKSGSAIKPVLRWR